MAIIELARIIALSAFMAATAAPSSWLCDLA
jgi:hypothetical protein